MFFKSYQSKVKNQIIMKKVIMLNFLYSYLIISVHDLSDTEGVV